MACWSKALGHQVKGLGHYLVQMGRLLLVFSVQISFQNSRTLKSFHTDSRNWLVVIWLSLSTTNSNYENGIGMSDNNHCAKCGQISKQHKPDDPMQLAICKINSTWLSFCDSVDAHCMHINQSYIMTSLSSPRLILKRCTLKAYFSFLRYLVILIEEGSKKGRAKLLRCTNSLSCPNSS